MKELLEKTHVKYGLIMSALTAAFILSMHLTGQYTNLKERSPIEFVFIALTPVLVWYFGIRAHKKKLLGKLSWKEGVKEGFLIALVYALTSPFVYLIYYLLINPEIVAFMRQEYGMQTSSLEMVILMDVLVQFVAALVMGTLYGAVIAVFLRTKKKS